MYLFSLVSIPLAYLALAAWTFGGGESTRRAFSRGLLLGLPAVIVWAFMRPLYALAWGSPLLIAGFLVRYWILPFGLTTAAFAASIGFYDLSRGEGYDRLVAFFFGSMSAFGAAFAISSWGYPSRVIALIVPVLVVASAVGFPVIVEESAKDGMPDMVKHMALALGGFIVAACAVSFFFMRLEWLGLVLSAAYVAGAALLGVRRLKRHPAA